jgi:hypothetical protein
MLVSGRLRNSCQDQIEVQPDWEEERCNGIQHLISLPSPRRRWLAQPDGRGSRFLAPLDFLLNADIICPIS